MILNHILAHLSSTDPYMAGVTSPMNWGEEIVRLSPSLPVAMGLCEVDAEGSVPQPESFEAFSQMALETMAQQTVELSLEATSNDGVQLMSFRVCICQPAYAGPVSKNSNMLPTASS